MFIWQLAAVPGLLAQTLVVARPLQGSHRKAGRLHAVVLAVRGHGIRALLHICGLLRERAPRVFQFTVLGLVLVLQQIGAAELERRGLADRLHQALGVRERGNSWLWCHAPVDPHRERL